jgi:hypothetical protein
METDPVFVNELRALFRAGATPSALIRRIAERHPDEPQIDRLVRAYFREAFHVPMLRVGREQVAEIVRGAACPALNGNVVHRMVAMRAVWDGAAVDPTTPSACWLDSLTATDDAEMLRTTEADTQSDRTSWWKQIDEEGRRFITRTVASARTLYEQVQVLAALAEQLQQRLNAAEGVEARGR